MSARPNDLLRVKGALENAQKALRFVDEFHLTEAHFTCDEPDDIILTAAVNSVLLYVTRMSEELSKVSFALASEHPELPWDDIRGVRNRMVHAYFDFDGKQIWEIIDRDLGDVVEFCNDALRKMGAAAEGPASRAEKPGHSMLLGALGSLEKHASLETGPRVPDRRKQ